jgi:YVTN family beta-propeller protein
MKAVSILRLAAWAGLVALVLGMQTALAEPLVYVPLGGEGKIVVVDAAKDEIVDTISGVTAVHGLAGTPDGRFLIAGSFEEREVGGEALAKPSGVSEDEHHVAVSPDGRFAVVTHPNQDAISAIDLRNYQMVATVPTGPLPNYAVFSPDSRRVYVSNAGNDTVSAIDATRWIVEQNIIVGRSPEHVVLSKDGGTLYVNNVDDGTVSVLDLRSGTVTSTIPVGDTLHGIDLSDDERTLFVSALGEDKLTAVDLLTGVYRSAMLSPAPYHLAAVRGTGKLYVSSADEPKIWVVDQKSLAVVGEIPIGGKGHQMVQTTGM